MPIDPSASDSVRTEVNCDPFSPNTDRVENKYVPNMGVFLSVRYVLPATSIYHPIPIRRLRIKRKCGSSVVRHLPLVLEVPGSIPVRGEKNFCVRTCFLKCH